MVKYLILKKKDLIKKNLNSSLKCQNLYSLFYCQSIQIISLCIWKLKSLYRAYSFSLLSSLSLSLTWKTLVSCTFFLKDLSLFCQVQSCATRQRLIMGYIFFLRLRVPPLIQTEKELSDKIQLLEVKDVQTGKY